ncbi:MAG TPA: TonB-dependent hemoglobin/transferrin/lactoferrin family receptor [Burkholderiaceae bacterium]|nr:TonB-dependent hemoglobin/transferrin/lactoferrin family receptor [Burkholderiaceae bacterium]
MKQAAPFALNALTVAVLAAATPALARTEEQGATRLDRVLIVAAAHRAERQIDDVAPSLTVITRKDIETQASFTLRDLLRYEPGVSIDNAPARFGLGNIAIRGLDGNRVTLLVDGVRLPDSYKVGSFSLAGRNQLDLGLLQRVEILRGPGSALYGSDALAGVIAFRTVDPADVLAAGAPLAAVADAGYASASESWLGGLLVAARAGAFEGLVGHQRLAGHETENFGTNESLGAARTAPNPQDTRRESWLGKLILRSARGDAYRVTLDRHTTGVETNVLSLNPTSSKTVRLQADDRTQRERASFDIDSARVFGLDRLRVLAYTQRALTVNDTVDERANTTAACLSANGTVRCLREVSFTYQQRETGASLVGELDRFGRWVFGVEGARTHTDEKRDGQQTNLDTGVTTKTVGTETLPTRDFPLSTTDRIGVFVQNEFEPLADLTLVPALRYDRHKLKPEIDPIFAAGNPGRPVVAAEDDALSPKFGVLWKVAPPLTLTAQWSTGYRAPPASDINIGLTNLPSGYTVIPNPDLQPERSRGVELGVRGRHARVEYTLTAFETRYRNLIVSRAPLPCPGDPRCVPGATGTFQSQNVDRARVRGVEASGLFRFAGPWAAQAAYTKTRGDDTGRDRPLNSIEPARLVAGLFYDTPRFSAAAHVTHVEAKERIDTSAGTLFATPSFTTLDLNASVQLTRALRLSIAVLNVTDRKYWLWSDMKGVLNPGASVDRYTQPGRSFNALLRARF